MIPIAELDRLAAGGLVDDIDGDPSVRGIERRNYCSANRLRLHTMHKSGRHSRRSPHEEYHPSSSFSPQITGRNIVLSLAVSTDP